MPRAVPWPDVASEPVLQCVRTETLLSGDLTGALARSHLLPCSPMLRFVSVSFRKISSAAAM